MRFIAFLVLLAATIAYRNSAFAQTGDRFRAFMIAYLTFRLVIDFIKPMPFVYFGLLSGIQLLCIAGLVYYRRDIGRLAGTVGWGRK